MHLDGKKLVLPTGYLVDRKNDMVLLYDYQNHNWIFLNSDGYEIVEYFKNDLTFDQVVGAISRKHTQVSLDDIKNKVLQFIQYLLRVKFLFFDRYEPMPRPERYRRTSPSACSIVFEGCNLNCVYCFNKNTRKDYQSRLRDMTTEEFKNALGQLLDFGVGRFMFSGGEPTLRKDLIELAKFVRQTKKGILMSLVTNGTHIDEENAREFANIFNLVWVSLDSYKKEEHEALRGKGSFDKTVRGIKLLVAQGKKNILVNSLVSDFNYKSMNDMQKFVKNELGADQFRMSEFQPFKSIGEPAVDDIKLSPPPPFFCLDDNKTALSLADIDRVDTGDLEKEDSYIYPHLHCGIAHGEISLHSNGNVFPCQSLTQESFKCGNILEEDIRKIYTDSPIMKRMRELDVYNLEDCKNCEVKYLCGGSCRAAAYEIHGDVAASFGDHCAIIKQRCLDKLWSIKAVPFQQLAGAKQEQN